MLLPAKPAATGLALVFGVVAATILVLAPRLDDFSPVIRTLRQQFPGGYVLHAGLYATMTLAIVATC